MECSLNAAKNARIWNSSRDCVVWFVNGNHILCSCSAHSDWAFVWIFKQCAVVSDSIENKSPIQARRRFRRKMLNDRINGYKALQQRKRMRAQNKKKKKRKLAKNTFCWCSIRIKYHHYCAHHVQCSHSFLFRFQWLQKIALNGCDRQAKKKQTKRRGPYRSATSSIKTLTKPFKSSKMMPLNTRYAQTELKPQRPL